MIIIIKIIGVKTESEETKLIKNSVFAVQFANTGILLLLVNANFSQALPLFGGYFFNGDYQDFTAEWYNDIGNQLGAAMIYNLYWPLFEFCMYWTMRFTFRQLDRGFKPFTLDDTKTSCVTL
jgi:hypothetical protein